MGNSSCPESIENFFRVVKKATGKQRTGVLLDVLQTPCIPYPCNFIHPQPLRYNTLAKIQEHLFFTIPYSAVLSCFEILEEAKKQCLESDSCIPFVNYEDAIVFVTFRNVFDDTEVHVENGSYMYVRDGGKHILDEGKTSDIIDVLKPQLASVPCEDLRICCMESWSKRKIRRMNEKYSSFSNALTIRGYGNCNIAGQYYPCLETTDGNDMNYKALEFAGAGYGEHLKLRQQLVGDFVHKFAHEMKLRILPLQTGTILEILHATLLGIDIVVSPYPIILANKGFALVFDIPVKYQPVNGLTIYTALEITSTLCNATNGVYQDDIDVIIDLNNDMYSLSINEKLHQNSVVIESRGYIHHLLKCKEINAVISLTTHNIWMMQILFKEIQKAITLDLLAEFVYAFMIQHTKKDISMSTLYGT